MQRFEDIWSHRVFAKFAVKRGRDLGYRDGGCHDDAGLRRDLTYRVPPGFVQIEFG